MALEMRHDKMSVTILLTAGHAKERRQGTMTVWILTTTGHGNMTFERLLLGQTMKHTAMSATILLTMRGSGLAHTRAPMAFLIL